MNQILIFPEDMVGSTATLKDYRSTHIFEILKAHPGQKIKIGIFQKNQGMARVISCHKNETTLEIESLSKPKVSILMPVTLVVALPRPQTLKKVLEMTATFGVGELIFIKTERVEKSFFQSNLLKNEAYWEHVYLGLQQGYYTQAPKISFFQNQDFWKKIESHPHKWIAHPTELSDIFSKPSVTTPLLLAIGPEGGWIESEISLFESRGFKKVSLGQTIHRVENAVCAALAQMELLLS